MNRVFLTTLTAFSLATAVSYESTAVVILKMYTVGMDSTWNVNENWEPFGVPHNSGPFEYHAYVPAPHIISLDLSATITTLSLTNSAQVWIGDLKTFTFYGATPEPGGSKVFNQGRIRVAAEGNPTTIRIDGGPVEFHSTEGGEVLMDAGFGGGFSQIIGTGGPTSSWLLNKPGHTFRGAGFFAGSLNVINEGTIMADNAAKALEIRVPDFTMGGTFANDGTLRAKDGATLKLLRSSPTATARYVHELGVVEALDGSTVLIDGWTIQHYGDFKTFGSGVIRVVDDFCSVRGTFYLDGDMRIDDGVTLDIDGSIVLWPGASVWIDTTAPNTGGLRLTSLGDASLSGGGTIELGDNATNVIYSSASNRRLTNAGCTIRGGGNLGGDSLSITNQSMIEADASVNPLRIDSPSDGDFTNDAGGWLLASTTPGIIIEDGLFINNGHVRIMEGSSLTRSGTYQQNGGDTIVYGSLTVTDGDLQLDGGSLHATGPINAAISNTGCDVNPGDIGQSPAILSVTGTYAQSAGGKLVIQLGGSFPGEYDWLTVSGDVALDGELLIATVTGYEPDPDDSFMIVNSQSGAVSGQFATVNEGWEVEYATNAVIIRPVNACSADVGGDGVVNVQDLIAVVSSWGACASPCPPRCSADVNNDCTVNVADLIAVVGAWGPCR